MIRGTTHLTLLALLAFATVITEGCSSAMPAQPVVDVQSTSRDEATADARVIESLRRPGSDLTKPHPTNYYLYFPQENDARAASHELESLGYRIKTLSTNKKGDWVVIASNSAIPSLPSVSVTTASLSALAKRHAGIYDGWEAAVTK